MGGVQMKVNAAHGVSGPAFCATGARYARSAAVAAVVFAFVVVQHAQGRRQAKEFVRGQAEFPIGVDVDGGNNCRW